MPSFVVDRSFMAGQDAASLLVSRVRCREVFLVLVDPLQGVKWDVCCLKGVCTGP